MMLAYIITIKGMQLSEDGADKCINSAKKHNFDGKILKFDATDKFDAPKLFKKLKLVEHPAFAGRNHPPVIGCFLSHYRLWKKCAAGTKPILVLEHDSLFTKDMPAEIPRFKHVLNFGSEAWITRKNKIRDYPEDTIGMVPTRYRLLLGAHGYALMPAGAKRLIAAAHQVGMFPADQHIRTDFVDIQDWLPSVIDQYTTFSTIRSERKPHVIAPISDWVVAADVWKDYDKNR